MKMSIPEKFFDGVRGHKINVVSEILVNAINKELVPFHRNYNLCGDN